SLGLPVIASNIPSYENLYNAGAPFIMCRTEQDWFKGLKYLEDRDNRKVLAEKGREYVSKFFNQKIFWEEWKSIFETPELNPSGTIKNISLDRSKNIRRLLYLSKAVECKKINEKFYYL